MRLPAIPTPDDFSSRLRSPAVAARVGLWLGVCFLVCFVTGLVSHYAQAASQPVPFPSSPSWGYRLTQGLHVITGTAAVPLLLVKLWSVLPGLFARPPLGDARRLVVHGLQRASVAVLVASGIFLLVTGLLNSAQWYPWAFSFRATHYAVAWIAVGSLAVHVAVQLPVIRDVLLGHVDATSHDRGATAGAAEPGTAEAGALSRRGLLRTTWAASGVAVLATAGIAVPWLREVSVLGVRSGEGPAGIPINKSAAAAGVVAVATSAAYRLVVTYGDRSVSLSRADLLAMRQHSETLPIACVEGWSASGTWTGVRVRDLLELVAAGGRDVHVGSLQRSGAFRSTVLPSHFAGDERTLLALALGGEPLSLDHGYPGRLIAPNRPGVLQTKWVTRLTVPA